MIVGTKQVADLIGVSLRRIAQLVDEGMPKQGRGKFDAAVCVQWYIAMRIEGALGPKGSSDVNQARMKLYDAQVIKTELETSRIKREMIPADEHMIDMNSLAVLFSSGLDAIGGRLASQLAGMNDPAVISEHLATETASIRESVADAITAYSATVCSADGI